MRDRNSVRLKQGWIAYERFRIGTEVAGVVLVSFFLTPIMCMMIESLADRLRGKKPADAPTMSTLQSAGQ